MNVNALVISYNSSISQSSTLQSLLDTDNKDINFKIFIWNNGPNLFEDHDIEEYLEKCKEKRISLSIYQDLRNISLSKIYNYIIKKGNFDFIAILDQDSTINVEYLQNIATHRKSNLIFPRIITEKNNVAIQSHPHSSKDKNILINEGPVTSNMSSVTSGIVLSKDLINKIEKYRGYVFEEKLGFYGIDVDFFVTINHMIEKNISVNAFCVGSINHLFSSNNENENENENEFKSPFRYLELLYFKIFFRETHQKKSKLTTLWICIREILRGKLPPLNAISVLRFAFENVHPRSKLIIKPDVEEKNCIYLECQK
ncbi:MAG: glycosyltransferase family 2 protein [Symbiopectobacterium sp.]|uniref:glycosyltransferase family 2 protein n=1 Tax=Symbiopectobacterium sp. TaxID=2952789 RepID=UPI0039E9947E